LVTIFSSIFCFYVISQNHETSKKIRYQSLPAIESVKEMRFLMQEVTRLTNNWIYFDNKRDKARLKTIYEKEYKSYTDRFKVVAEETENPEVKKIIEEIVQTNDIIMESVGRVMQKLNAPEDYMSISIHSRAVFEYEKVVLYYSYNTNNLYRESLNKLNNSLEKLQEHRENLHNHLFYVVLVLLAVVIFASVSSMQYARKGIVRPILTLKNVIQEVAKGEVNSLPSTNRKDEIGEIQNAISNMIGGLQQKIKFADEIGKSNYNAQFTLLSNNDKLGNALLEMRDNLKANEFELKNINLLLENKVNEVENAQKRQDALLEKASEIITIYNADKIVKYESPSVLNILGYTPDELLGNYNESSLHPDDKILFEKKFEECLADKNKITSFKFRYKHKNGNYIWMESTLTNLMNQPGIEGLVMNSRDITIALLAEKEQNMRSKMQSLSENSPDLILRIGINSTVYYANPVIENFTNLHPEHVIHKKVADLPFSKEVLEAWDYIQQNIVEGKDKISFELVIPNHAPFANYSVNAIAEYSDNHDLETILVVCHNISEQKKAELEIKEINKKITESINYSHRIQSSLLPSEKNLTTIFNDAFIFYVPKDVVSGDFPFLYQKNNITYVAAVDCTGHGVPGALMSLIGHFILEQIMAECSLEANCGEILDQLHAKVQRTLKQDTGESTASDGMDIALLKINKETNQVDFAGAHRPLYYVQNDELLELKGDKYPIGGMHYKNRKSFSNHTLKLKKDDLLVMNTDGLPDQFGGELGKERFMSKRIKEIIDNNKQKKGAEIREKISADFYSWKGKYKQIDDVLLIGIRV
jgi:PAS domain S-box-containing protein